jgi:hypothetical protein
LILAGISWMDEDGRDSREKKDIEKDIVLIQGELVRT